MRKPQVASRFPPGAEAPRSRRKTQDARLLYVAARQGAVPLRLYKRIALPALAVLRFVVHDEAAHGLGLPPGDRFSTQQGVQSFG